MATVDIKNEPSVVMETCSRNRTALNELLTTDFVEVIDEDLTIIVGSRGFGQPLKTNSDDLVKRQDDPVSGSLAYSQTVRILFNFFDVL